LKKKSDVSVQPERLVPPDAQGAAAPTPRELKTRPAGTGEYWRVIGISLFLAAMIWIVFGQTRGFGFVNYDDDYYVYKNPMVMRGLSLEGILWAFTHIVSDHWHPLTVIVLMLDNQMFGLWAGGYHLVNVMIHAAAAIFLFLMLREMTGALWRSGFVAAVFAIHPLRVESVAWISECKDVLSGMFFMLTLWAYVRYTRDPRSRGRYAMVILWFALGLISKEMLVTAPCVLLLLDYWPLRRLRTLSQFPALLWEKMPLIALSAISCLAAITALKTGNPVISSYPANAPISYLTYLDKLFYPSRLAPLYPIPKGGFPAWQVFDATLLLAAVSGGALFLRRKEPYVLVGWLWYLGMLVPVAGVMQTGDQAYADRYTYLPQIGLYIACAWMAANWAGQFRGRRVLLGAAAAGILCVLPIAARRQTSYWRDSETLWTHALASTEDNYVAHNDLGSFLLRKIEPEAAIAHFQEAVRIKPDYVAALNNLAFVLATCPDARLRNGVRAEGLARYANQLEGGRNPSVLGTLAAAFAEQGRFPEALDIVEQGIQAAKAQGNDALTPPFRRDLKLYQAGQPLRAFRGSPADSSQVPPS